MPHASRSCTGRAASVLLALASCAALCACDVRRTIQVDAPPDTVAGEVAFEVAGPQGIALLVPVFLNGSGPLDFVLDTGATMTCVSTATAERLALPRRRGAVGVGVGVGGAGRIGFVAVDSLRLGQARATGLSACVLDLEHMEAIGPAIDGLLGLDFLREFRVTLDFERNVLILVEPGS